MRFNVSIIFRQLNRVAHGAPDRSTCMAVAPLIGRDLIADIALLRADTVTT